MLTRVFKSGNSLAVRIPKELAIVKASQDIEIEKVGDTLVLRPVVKRKLTGLAAAFAAFPPGFMAEQAAEIPHADAWHIALKFDFSFGSVA
ncbi:MAG: AbrB/MazE/SpoVT family DNA-binding domain-containing protein [Thiobacillus sp.]|jgi:antitoxin VapB